MPQRQGAEPVIVITPHLDDAQRIAGWLRGAGLSAISTVRTCDEAIFVLGRGCPALLIIDEATTARAERRLLQHIAIGRDVNEVPLIRLVGNGAQPNGNRTVARTVIRKPLQAHDVVVRVGDATHRPDLLGYLDKSLDQAAQHLQAARQMQIGLLPTPGALRALQAGCQVGVAALYRSGEEVGGDFWGIWPTSRGRLALTLVDFAGHGLSAALNTFRLHALLADPMLPRGQPTRMTALLNERLHVLLPRGQYATMVYLQIDPRQRLVAWCGAGGPPPLMVSPDRADDLDSRGVPLGVRANTTYRRRWMRLPPAGVLAVFSDGLFESGGREPDVPRADLADALAPSACLAAKGDPVAAAHDAVARLEALRDLYPCAGHSDDVMAICLAFGPDKS